jgi:hypothetical protein
MNSPSVVPLILPSGLDVLYAGGAAVYHAVSASFAAPNPDQAIRDGLAPSAAQQEKKSPFEIGSR